MSDVLDTDTTIHNDGPCPRCSECVGETHHWSDIYVGDAEDEPEHPAVLAGRADWYACKHCDAWRADLPDDVDDEDAAIDESLEACRILGIDTSGDYDYLGTLRAVVAERDAAKAALTATGLSDGDGLAAGITTLALEREAIVREIIASMGCWAAPTTTLPQLIAQASRHGVNLREAWGGMASKDVQLQHLLGCHSGGVEGCIRGARKLLDKAGVSDRFDGSDGGPICHDTSRPLHSRIAIVLRQLDEARRDAAHLRKPYTVARRRDKVTDWPAEAIARAPLLVGLVATAKSPSLTAPAELFFVANDSPRGPLTLTQEGAVEVFLESGPAAMVALVAERDELRLEIAAMRGQAEGRISDRWTWRDDRWELDAPNCVASVDVRFRAWMKGTGGATEPVDSIRDGMRRCEARLAGGAS